MKSVLLIVTLFFSTNVFAQQWGVVGGLNMAGGEVEADGVSADFDREIGFEIGARFLNDFEGFQLRTGVHLVSYNSTIDTNIVGIGQVDADYSAMQLMVPVTLQKMVSERFGFFGGAGISLHLSDDYSINGFDVDPENTSVFLTLQIGAIFMINEVSGIELSFDYGLNDFAEDTTANVIATKFVYFFKK